MPPKELAGGYWFIPEGEFVENPKNPKERIDGPASVRVHEFPDLNKLSVQGASEGRKVLIEIDGMDFPAVVMPKGRQ